MGKQMIEAIEFLTNKIIELENNHITTMIAFMEFLERNDLLNEWKEYCNEKKVLADRMSK